MKVLILAPYPLGKAPSQRFRFEHFLDDLQERDIQWDFQSFVSDKGWDVLYKKGNVFKKAFAVIAGFIRRKLMLLRASRYDYIFIHRELTPFGPPIFEWFLAKVLKKKIIYDFDDAIWLADQDENFIRKWLKWRSKVKNICRWSWRVSAGNEYLAAFAQNHCADVIVIPTIVNTESHKAQNPKPITQNLTIGWTGSHSTLFYLYPLAAVLQKLEKRYDFEFLVIANKNPNLPLKNFRFIPWAKETEIEDLAQIDIGVMPLEDNEWAKGKCGFKLIQYLSLSIPAVASPVGVNADIITHGKNGFLASDAKEWKKYLIELLDNEGLRKILGQKGRRFVEENYSSKKQKDKFLHLFS